MTAPRQHLTVGLPCAGMTTLARELARTRPAVHLAPDEWRLALFGPAWRDPVQERGLREIGRILDTPPRRS